MSGRASVCLSRGDGTRAGCWHGVSVPQHPSPRTLPVPTTPLWRCPRGHACPGLALEKCEDQVVWGLPAPSPQGDVAKCCCPAPLLTPLSPAASPAAFVGTPALYK